MSKWGQSQGGTTALRHMEMPKPEPKDTLFWECIYGNHKAELLHRGTAYCRSCYDRNNLTGTLIN